MIRNGIIKEGKLHYFKLIEMDSFNLTSVDNQAPQKTLHFGMIITIINP